MSPNKGLTKAEHIKSEAGRIDRHSENLFWQAGQLLQASGLLKQKNIRAGASASLKGYLVDYKAASSARSVPEINVELPIDGKIPFNSRLAGVYISHVGLVISAINFCRKEFGEKVNADVADLLSDLAGLFGEAVEIYKNAQTSFTRTGQGGLGVKFIRFVDNNNNACPSLHAEIVGFIHSRINWIIRTHADDPEIYKPIEDLYFNKTVRVLEAVLLVKQHVVIDIALGLALLSSHKSFFSKEQAYEMVNAMFQQDNYGMDAETIAEIRSTIILLYDEAEARIVAKKNSSAGLALIAYLRDFGTKNFKSESFS